jgi:hypothetical protein
MKIGGCGRCTGLLEVHRVPAVAHFGVNGAGDPLGVAPSVLDGNQPVVGRGGDQGRRRNAAQPPLELRVVEERRPAEPGQRRRLPVGGEFGRYPPAERPAHDVGPVKPERVDDVEVVEDQVIDLVNLGKLV